VKVYDNRDVFFQETEEEGQLLLSPDETSNSAIGQNVSHETGHNFLPRQRESGTL